MLVEIILILPLATPTVERGFSAMKRVKNDWRSCLETDILNMLLRITINGCSLYLIPRELFNIGGLQDKEHVDQTFRGILRILN